MPSPLTQTPLATQPKPQRVVWLAPLIFLVNLAGLGLVAAYSQLNLRPDLSDHDGPVRLGFLALNVMLVALAPTIATWVQVAPVARWLRAQHSTAGVPPGIAQQAANLPLAMARFSLLAWLIVAAIALARAMVNGPDMPLGVTAHLVLRPVLAGLISATTLFLAAEFICRTDVWPVLLVGTRISTNAQLRRVHIAHRLAVLWLAVGALPLAVIALTTYARVAGLDLSNDPLLERVVSVVLLVAIAAAIGGAWLAWLVSRSIAQPLETLEAAIAALRDGHYGTRMPVNSTDEIGAVTEGFNLMAERLERTHTALTGRNRDLTRALDRVIFLEHVKDALDRFVPESVRQAIEADPHAPGLGKKAMDVTVLFLDIEGYSRLSEELPRPTLNALVEHYFSLFLASIRDHGGDINETAGDGLMIIFQSGGPDAHAAAALQAALAIQAQTTVANLDAGPTRPEIRINIGISSGECDVGTTRFQSPTGERWTFTASGPVTNLAARLSAHASGGQILLTEETARRLQGRIPVRSLGQLVLKNLSHPVVVWEVLPSGAQQPTDAAGACGPA